MGGEGTEIGALHILGLAARLGGAMLLRELVEWDILAMREWGRGEPTPIELLDYGLKDSDSRGIYPYSSNVSHFKKSYYTALFFFFCPRQSLSPSSTFYKGAAHR